MDDIAILHTTNGLAFVQLKASSCNETDVVWRPLYTREESGRLDEILHALAKEVVVRGAGFGSSVGGGSAGVALFYSYLNRFIPDVRFRDQAILHASRAMAQTKTERWNPSLFNGFPGAVWAAEHIQERHGHDLADVLSETIDGHLLDAVRVGPWLGSLDLCEGLVGVGLYALRNTRESSRNILEQVIYRLTEVAIHTDEGVTWMMPVTPAAPIEGGDINLGVAHGVPAVIALLAQVCRAGVCVQTVRPLLRDAIAWLFAQRNPSDMTSTFGYSAGPRSARLPGESRLAWCYGDLGVSSTLFVAGTSIAEPSWIATALEMAVRAADRPVELSGVRDAGLCHGAAGNAHLFNRFYQATGDSLFRHAARRWFDIAIGFYRPSISIGGFPVWNDNAPPGVRWGAPGLLTGAAGIGLAFLAAISDVEPSWDRLLLASAH